MEFGTSTRIPGKSVIGISWTSFRNTKEANLLITTSESRIQIYSADDQRVISSWLTRPGSYNRFTVAAVQHRIWRQVFVVQNETKLYSWNENQTSLENAVKIKVRNDVFCLRTSKHIPALVCVYRDGGISIYNEHLHELYYTAGVTSSSASAASSSTGTTLNKQNDTKNSNNQVTTWARLTSIPGQPNCCVLMVLTQSLPDNNGNSSSTTTTSSTKVSSKSSSSSSSSSQSTRTLRVFTLSASTNTTGSNKASSQSSTATTNISSGGSIPTVTLKYITTHTLLPPSFSTESSIVPSYLRITSITLHKHLHQLGIFWNNGLMQMLQFIPTNRSQVLNWFSCPLVQVLTRELSKILPEASSSITSSNSLSLSSTSSSPASFHVAAFGLEPSCVVLAGNQGKTIGMSVWDVRYGIMLDIKSINEENTNGDVVENDYEQPEDFTITNNEDDDNNNTTNNGGKGSGKKSSKKGNRNRSDSTGSNASVGSLLSSAQAIAGGDLTPDSVFQITVSEDGSFVAIAARNRIFLTPVAVRGASLASALGRLVPTQSLLSTNTSTALVQKNTVYPNLSLPFRQEQPITTVPVSVAPVINLQKVLDTVLSSSNTSNVPSGISIVSSWSKLLSNEAAGLQKDVTNILSKLSTPTLASIVKILINYDNSVINYINIALDNENNSSTNASSKDTKKRKSAVDKSKKDDTVGNTVTSSSTSSSSIVSSTIITTKIVPPVLVTACTQRCVQELVDKYESFGSSTGTTSSSLSLDQISLLLNYLVIKKYLTFSISTDLFTTLLSVLGTCSRNHQITEGVTVMLIIRNILLHLTDIPEGLLIQTFTTIVKTVSATILATVWDKISAEIQKRKSSSSESSPVTTTKSVSVTHKSVLGLLYITSLIIRAPRNDVFLENSLSSLLDNNQLNILLACIARLLALHTTTIIAPVLLQNNNSNNNYPSNSNNLKRLRKEYTIDDEESYTADTYVVDENILYNATTTSSTTSSSTNTTTTTTTVNYNNSSYIYFPLPSYGQVLDWIRMVIDSHFARIILLAKANNNNSSTTVNNRGKSKKKNMKNQKYNSIQFILRDIQKIIQAQTRLCDEASDLQGHLTHILQRLPLSQPPEPEYSIDTLTL